jgi:hypothetical protein
MRAFDLGGLPAVIDLALAAPEDFEAGSGGFTGGGQWQWGTPTDPRGPTAHSGSQLWGTNLAGSYASSFSHALTSPGYDLTPLDQPRLSFWHWYEIWGPYDGINVEISTNGGSVWEVVEPVGGYPDPCISGLPGSPCEPGWTGSSGDWLPAVFDLADYADHTVVFRFTLGPYDFSSTAGWFIDDLQVFGVTSTVAVEALAAAPPRTQLGAPAPTPASGPVSLGFTLASPAAVTLRIYDAAGRHVRTLTEGPLAAGAHSARWDGRDARGATVGSGVYFLRLEADRELEGGVRALTRKIVVTR